MKQFIILLLIILLSTNLVYSKGTSEESDIDRAITLIQEKKFDEAIRLLTVYSLENPQSIYEVQDLLDNIRVERGVINNLMDDLITAIYDEEDFEKGDRIINQIKELNPNPDQLSKLFLRNARNAATFVVNKKKFKTLMDQAFDHLQRDEYREALDKYLLCLDFHRDEFDLLLEELETTDNVQEVDLAVLDENIPLNRYYTTLKNSSFLEVDKINTNTVSLQNFVEEIKAAYVNADALINEDVIDIERLSETIEIFKNVPSVIEQYESVFNNLSNYNELFSKITLDGTNSNFISYANLTLTGRVNQEEGIFYIIKNIYPKYVDTLISKIEDRIDLDLQGSLTSYSNRDFVNSKLEFDSTITDLQALDSVATLWKSFVTVDDEEISDKLYLFGDSRVGMNISNGYKKIIDYVIDVEKNTNELGLLDLREYIELQLEEVKKDINYWSNEQRDIDSGQLALYKKSSVWVKDIIQEYNSLNSNYIGREIDIVNQLSKDNYIAIFGFDISESDNSVDAMADLIQKAAKPTNELEEIKVYFDINNTDERTLTTYNPEKSLNELNNIESEYSNFITGLEGYLESFTGEKDYIVSNITFDNRFQSVQNALRLANVNRTTLIGYKEEAQDKIILSKESQNRGVTLYENALSSFEQENFNDAREFIENAKNVAISAISYSKNSFIIDEFIPSLYELDNEINQEEARIVIRDVRLLITQGKTKYLEGAYIPASDLFREAELRWAETNSDDHPEIPYWLALIRDALAIESGRYLNVTEPLYSILAGYLSFAETYYRDGIKEDNKVNKLKSFAVADSYLLKVLEVRPLNERARFLQLQVLKSKDPESFSETFSNDFIRYRNSVVRALENVTSLDSNRVIPLIEAYEAIITDAYRLNPRLSGSSRRAALERFYLPPNTAGKSQAQINSEKQENDDNRQTINESYTRFKDLYKIAEDEQKKDVERLINLSEVALGFKRLPVDTSNIRRSNEIFTSAKKSLEGVNQTETDKLNSILVDLQRALSLNPGNEDIPVVIDDILVMLGEESNFQLAPNEDRLFREAQKDFIEGNYFEARDKIINILQANSKNKNYPKLKELINRVEIKLKVEITI